MVGASSSYTSLKMKLKEYFEDRPDFTIQDKLDPAQLKAMGAACYSSLKSGAYQRNAKLSVRIKFADAEKQQKAKE